MPKWKLNIFVNAIKARMTDEGKTASVLLEEYTRLIEDERREILQIVTNEGKNV